MPSQADLTPRHVLLSRVHLAMASAGPAAVLACLDYLAISSVPRASAARLAALLDLLTE